MPKIFGMWRSPIAYPADSGMVAETVEYLVYILYSEKLGKYYAGQTNNIEKRLIAHNKGGKKYTSRGVPWKLVKTCECRDRSEAVRLESRIKKRGIRRYLDEN